MKTKLVSLAVAVGLLFSAATASIADDNIPTCDSKEEARGPQNDSQWDWDEGKIDIPCFSQIYTITGTVSTDVNSLTIQTSPGYSSGGGSMFGSGGMMYGSVGWDSVGATTSGKGFVRLNVLGSDSDLAPVGATTIIKTTDTKTMALLPGDTVTFKCRKEYEAVGAIATSEKFTTDTRDQAATYELDYCRLASPVVVHP